MVEYYNRTYHRSFPTIQIFIEHHKEYPSIIYIDNLNWEQLSAFLERQHIKWHRQIEFFDEDQFKSESRLLVLEYGVMDLEVDRNRAEITFFYRQNAERKAKSLAREIANLREVRKESHIYLISLYDHDLSITPFEINRPDLDIGLYYGEAFLPVFDTIYRRLSLSKDKGIVLLYGMPGTGKTTLLRYLISSLADKKKIIYLPPDLTKELASPAFIPFLMRHPDSILIIEDAENILKIRSNQSHQALANLLNLSDGLLSDCLSIQVVCSFNCDIEKIDPALIRKGRLIAKHYFDRLTAEQAQRVCDHNDIPLQVEHPMTLADIFHHDEQDYEEDKAARKFGF